MKVVTFSVVAEAATGLVLVVAPAIAATLLLGTELSAPATVAVRCFGIALVSLGVACWPGRPGPEGADRPLLAMMIYNLLITVLLGFAGAVEQIGGVLLWPAVILHAIVGLLLVRDWLGQGREAPNSR